MPEDKRPQARHWRSAAAALEVVRRRSAPTRRELAQELGLASGPASDLVGRLRAARLIAERPAAVQGPGRPTTRLHAHPDGPVVLAVDLRHDDWRMAVAGLDGELEHLASGRHRGGSADAVLGRLRRGIMGAADQFATLFQKCRFLFVRKLRGRQDAEQHPPLVFDLDDHWPPSEAAYKLLYSARTFLKFEPYHGCCLFERYPGHEPLIDSCSVNATR